MAFRYGGDEFCILLPEVSTRAARRELSRLTESLCNTVGNRLNHAIGCSFGIATARPGFYPAPDHLIAAADRAMYEEKPMSGDRVRQD